MGLEGGQPESQLTGGSEGGSEVLPEEPVEGGQTAEVDCQEQSAEEADQDEVEDSCLPEDEALPVEGGAQESTETVEEVAGGELVEEESEESDPSEG